MNTPNTQGEKGYLYCQLPPGIKPRLNVISSETRISMTELASYALERLFAEYESDQQGVIGRVAQHKAQRRNEETLA